MRIVVIGSVSVAADARVGVADLLVVADGHFLIDQQRIVRLFARIRRAVVGGGVFHWSYFFG